MATPVLTLVRTISPAALESAMVATLAAVATEEGDTTEVGARHLATMAAAFIDLCRQLGVMPPVVVWQHLD